MRYLVLDVPLEYSYISLACILFFVLGCAYEGNELACVSSHKVLEASIYSGGQIEMSLFTYILLNLRNVVLLGAAHWLKQRYT